MALYDRLQSHYSSKLRYPYSEEQVRVWQKKVDAYDAKGQERGERYLELSEKSIRRRWWWRDKTEVIVHLFEGILLAFS